MKRIPPLDADAALRAEAEGTFDELIAAGLAIEADRPIVFEGTALEAAALASESLSTPAHLHFVVRRHPDLWWLASLKPAPKEFYRRTAWKLRELYPGVTETEWGLLPG